MSFISAFVYDRCMKSTEEACLIDWRADLLKPVSGKVLEIGAGTGASLALYPQTEGLHLFLSEPDKNMRKQLAAKVKLQQRKNVSILPCSSDSISAGDNEFDYVFASLVCCSINDVEAALKEIKRVLKPSGCFIFLEHVAANKGSNRRKWQNRINPIWKKLAGNCHLNRETEALIKGAGFTIENIQYESMRKAMPLVRPTIRGMARNSAYYHNDFFRKT